MVESLISIIIPVYNVESYLSECIESVICQTYRNLEIILVDDGSYDRSPVICDEFAKKDSRIIVKHIPNSGSTNARKQGLQIAKGMYIGFVDSDDWIDSTMYEELYALACSTKADIIASAFKVENTSISIQDKNSILSGVYTDDLLSAMVYQKMIDDKDTGEYGLLPNLWNKLFKKELIYENLMRLDNRIFYGEDAAVVYCSCLDAKTVCIVNKKWYHYRIRDDSVCTTSNDKIFKNNMLLYDHLSDKIRNMNVEVQDKITQQLKRFILKLNFYGIKKVYDIDIKYSNFWIFPFDKVPKGSKIILYGAGNVGKLYYKQLEKLNMYKVVAWVDVNYERSSVLGLSLISPKLINEYEYDYIVIALSDIEVAKNVATSLVNKGVSQEKLIWGELLILRDVNVLQIPLEK